MLKWWIIISIVALVIDATTSNLFFICFTFGGIIAMITALFGVPPFWQSVVFGIVTILSLASIIPFLKKQFKSSIPEFKSAESRLVGREMIVDTDIQDEATISIDSIYWTVKNTGEPLKAGDAAIITGIEGSKLLIKKLNEQGGDM